MKRTPLKLTGQKFGRLTVIARAGKDKHNRWQWWCLCNCGEYIIVRGASLEEDNTKSCGCLRRKLCSNRSRTHGKRYTPEYNIWNLMKQRCSNSNDFNYKHYGGRGITVCDRWNDFANFWDDMCPRPSPELTLERLNNDLGYSKDNCAWRTWQDQSRNRRIQKNK